MFPTRKKTIFVNKLAELLKKGIDSADLRPKIPIFAVDLQR